LLNLQQLQGCAVVQNLRIGANASYESPDIFNQLLYALNPLPSAFFPLENPFFTAKAVFEVLWCQMPLNFATKAFSYILAQF